jgi:hypothetical protein
MARADTKTLLSLDRWAKILGLEPRHFNQVSTDLRPTENCGDVWLQYAWQAADRVGRDDVAQAIAQAESDIIDALGFYPLPVWTEGEIQRTARPNDAALVGGSGLYNTRGLYQSVQTQFGHVITGGVESKALIATALRTAAPAPGDTMALADLDTDGYYETTVITLPTTVTDINEVRCYFHDKAGADEWEIRPLRSVAIAGGVVTITLDTHLLVDPDLWEALDAKAVDGDVTSNFVLEVDVYQVTNDPSDMAELQWEATPGYCGCTLSTCQTCAWAVQDACLQLRDPRLGIVTYRPATWNAATGDFDAATIAMSRQPERVALNYLSGYQSSKVARPRVEMDPLLERMITYYSVTLLDRPICNCNNVESFIKRWTEDRAMIAETGQYHISQRDSECPWGTKEGALWAWKRVQKLAIGQGVEYP